MNKTDKYWLAFASIEKFSSTFIQRLFEHFGGDIEHAWKADVKELLEIEDITKKQFDAFTHERQKRNPDDCYSYIKNKGIDYFNYDDDKYPSLLKQIYNPPMTLFMAGDIDRCNPNRTLAVVGSRRASKYSKDILTSILDKFAGTDICIVSGLATGIDTTAHIAAVKNNLATIGVIAGGFEHLYPTSNKQLFEQIKDTYGAVLSEYWPTSEPIAWRFPHRNRIVSGLSKGTLVAEAALKSGALITAHLCLEHNRELMCIPGMITNPNTAGIYKLLKEGAALVTSAEDILTTMDWQFTKQTFEPNKLQTDLTDGESLVYNLISMDSLTVDEIILKTNLTVGDLMVILTKLEIKGLIQQIEGEKYSALAVIG
ncbi:MAG: DNA-processing protein DprA [Candidatus Gastranaerophilales bacterium]|nr:DNA-processing protein DprA [Candidatus Gastranaerophilales bacterium]